MKKESPTAIGHWWGISAQTVTGFRGKLGITERSEGTRRLQVAYGSHPDFQKLALEEMWKTLSDPARAAKISAAKTGVSRPPEVIAKLRAANLGRKLSKAQRKKMSEAAHSPAKIKQRKELHQSNVGRKHSKTTKRKPRSTDT